MTDIKEIFKQLSAYFPPQDHSVRDLPGNAGKWVYIRWQKVQDRLNEVSLSHEFSFEEIQYNTQTNEAVIRVSLKIEGIKKQAIASVPIELISSKGKDMARGSVTDRLHAEAIKKAAEAWGVGKYLEDQVATLSYLLKPGNAPHLDPETHKALIVMAKQKQKEMIKQDPQVFKDVVRHPATNTQVPVSNTQVSTPTPNSKNNGNRGKITDPQNRRLWAIARQNGYNSDGIKALLKPYGIEDTRELAFADYDGFIITLEAQSANNF